MDLTIRLCRGRKAEPDAMFASVEAALLADAEAIVAAVRLMPRNGGVWSEVPSVAFSGGAHVDVMELQNGDFFLEHYADKTSFWPFAATRVSRV